MRTSELPYLKEVFSIVTQYCVRTDEASGSRKDSWSKVTTRGHRFRGVGPHEPTGPATTPLDPVGSPRGAPPTRRTVGKRSGSPSPDRADLTRDPPRVLLPIPVVGPPLRLPFNLVRSNRRGDGGGLRRPSVLHVRIVECPGRSGVCVPKGRRSGGGNRGTINSYIEFPLLKPTAGEK